MPAQDHRADPVTFMEWAARHDNAAANVTEQHSHRPVPIGGVAVQGSFFVSPSKFFRDRDTEEPR